MRTLKPSLQQVADDFNKLPLDEDNVGIIRQAVITESKVRKAILAKSAREEQIISSTLGKNPIVTPDEIRKDMNREIGD